MLKAVSLSRAHDGDLLFAGLDLIVGTGARIGVVGPNGAGKTTLLRVLAGELAPTSGTVTRAPGCRVGFVAQQVPDPGGTVGDLLTAGLGAVPALTRRMHRLAEQLADGADVLDEYAQVQERWTALRGWTAESRLAEVTQRLDVAHLAPDTVLARVSGGEQARLMLARVLLDDPDVLLLDEPTNHLDADGAAWLSRRLADFRGGLVTVSHDRAFLDGTVTRIIELDGLDATPQDYPGGGYTAYRQEKARRWARLLADYEAQEKDRARWEADIARTKAHAVGVETTVRSGVTAPHLRRVAKKVAKKAKARERRLRRQMQSARWIAAPRERPPLTLAFGADDAVAGEPVLAASGLRLTRGGRPLLDGVDVHVAAGDRIHLSGRNGAGKSTLLRVLAGLVAPDAGDVTRLRPVALLPQTSDGLRTDVTVLDHFRAHVPVYAEDAERLLDAHLFGPDTWSTPLRSLSAGELRRLLLAVMVNAPARVLLLDEPTNYLDFDALDVVEQALQAFRGTLLTVTHDAHFAAAVRPGRHWHLHDGTVHED